MKNHKSSTKKIQRRHIEALIAIDDFGSVHKAAKELGCPQPVLSRTLSETESIFGVSLFNRSSHGCKPTLQGEEVISRSRLALRAMHKVENSAAELRPTILLGCIPRVMHTFMPNLLAYMHPDIAIRQIGFNKSTSFELKVTEGSSKLLFDLIVGGNLDFGILRNQTNPLPNNIDDIVMERIYDEKTVLICSASHPEIKRKLISIDTLSKFSWALPEIETTSRLAFDQFWENQNLNRIKPIIEPRSFESNIALVASTKLISIAPESIAKAYVKLGVLKIINTRSEIPANPIMLAFKKAAQDDVMLSKFRSLIHLIGKSFINN